MPVQLQLLRLARLVQARLHLRRLIQAAAPELLLLRVWSIIRGIPRESRASARAYGNNYLSRGCSHRGYRVDQ
jgi:hypothetical protein